MHTDYLCQTHLMNFTLCNHLRNISLENAEVFLYVVQGHFIKKMRS